MVIVEAASGLIMGHGWLMELTVIDSFNGDESVCPCVLSMHHVYPP